MAERQNVLVTGAAGQIGSELVPALRARYGADRVVASDVRLPARVGDDGPFEPLDCTESNRLREIVSSRRIATIYHVAALLSAVAEERPHIAWNVNLGGLYNVLEAARSANCAVFFPSSVGSFGPTTPHENTPQDTIQRPTTLYGVTKVAGELLCDYYARRFAVDARGIRFPGLISNVAPAGGGTTDFAVEVFYQAVSYRHYTCFVGPETRLDMVYMPDAIDGMIQLMEADPKRLLHRNAFNVTAMNVTPEELAQEIRKHISGFVIEYDVDPMRQAIADSWPQSLDDSAARAEWDWSPQYDLEKTVADMLGALGTRLRPPR